MAEVEITRKQIIVVGEVGTNSYGDLTWTDKEGKEYKVKSTRSEYFKDVIVPGQAVQLNFATYKGHEYPYSAEAVMDKIEAVQPTHLTEKGTLVPAKQPSPTSRGKEESAMSKTDWSEKDRITRESIQRQTALKSATDIACAQIVQGKEMSTGKVIEVAKLFEAYLEGNYLVDEAKKLIKKGEG